MPSTTVPSNAPGLPSRRLALTALASLGAAVALPKAVHAIALPVPSPDAALIALAAKVEAQAAKDHVAWERLSRLDDRYMRLRPARPTYPSTVPGLPPVEERSAAEMREHLTKAAECNPPAALAGYIARVERMEAYEAACEALRRRLALPAADRYASRQHRRLSDAAEQLTEASPVTIGGAVAKARAAFAAAAAAGAPFVAPAEWLATLTHAALRDVAAIVGAA